MLNLNQVNQLISPTFISPQITKKRCRCGSTTHLRINSEECPLNKKLFTANQESRRPPLPPHSINRYQSSPVSTRRSTSAIIVLPRNNLASTSSSLSNSLDQASTNSINIINNKISESMKNKNSCKCGSFNHQRISSLKSKLNPKKCYNKFYDCDFL